MKDEELRSWLEQNRFIPREDDPDYWMKIVKDYLRTHDTLPEDPDDIIPF